MLQVSCPGVLQVGSWGLQNMAKFTYRLHEFQEGGVEGGVDGGKGGVENAVVGAEVWLT